MNKEPRTLIIIPAYNEEENLAETVREVRECAPFADILVVDDGSTDRTIEVAKKCDVLIASHLFNLKIGGAMQTGFKIAKRENYDVAVQIDGDGQHNAHFLSQVMKPIIEGKADIVIGSRYLKNKNANSSLIRHAGVWFYSQLTTKITKNRITDCTSGFRALNKRAIDLFAEEYPADFPDAEALILAHRTGLKITETPVQFRNRERGKSSLHTWRLLYYPLKETFSIIMLLTKKPRKK